jgi:hypothetical protein
LALLDGTAGTTLFGLGRVVAINTPGSGGAGYLANKALLSSRGVNVAGLSP